MRTETELAVMQLQGQDRVDGWPPSAAGKKPGTVLARVPEGQPVYGNFLEEP